MIKAFAILILISISVCGWGILARQFIKTSLNKDIAIPNFGEIGLLGLISILYVSLIANFVMPLGSAWSIIVLLIGIMATVANLKILRRSFGTQPKLALLLAFVIIVSFSLFATKVRGVLQFDFGLYQLQTILWINQEPAALGLANLHDRFGFNSTWLLIAANFWNDVFGLSGIQMAPAMLSFFVLMALMLPVISPFQKGTGPFELAFSIGLAFIVLLISRHLTFTPVLWTDQASALFAVMAAKFFVRFWEQRSLGNTRNDFELMCIFLFTAAAITMKLSYAVFGLLPLCLLIALSRNYHNFRSQHRSLQFGLIASSLLGIVWIARNVVLSGCLLFPISSTCITSLKWTADPIVVDSTKTIIEDWARLTKNPLLFNDQAEMEAKLSNFNWWTDWMAHSDSGGLLLEMICIFLSLVLAGVFLLIIAELYRK